MYSNMCVQRIKFYYSTDIYPLHMPARHVKIFLETLFGRKSTKYILVICHNSGRKNKPNPAREAKNHLKTWI